MSVPSTIRYFTNGDDVIVVEEVIDGILRSVGNTHVLEDKRDPSSGPIDGWAEVTKKQFEAKEIRNIAKFKRDADLAEGIRLAAIRQTYQEALLLGFTDTPARSISGYAGPGLD